MEGVDTTPPTTAQEDPIEEWSDMEGMERKGLFASQYAPELGAPVATPALVPEVPKKKEKGKAKEVQIAVPQSPVRARARAPKCLAHQQKHRAAADAARAEKAQVSPRPEVATVRSILKRPETAAAEKAKKEEQVAAKAAVKERWEKGELNEEEREVYNSAATPIKYLAADGEDMGEVAAG